MDSRVIGKARFFNEGKSNVCTTSFAVTEPSFVKSQFFNRNSSNVFSSLLVAASVLPFNVLQSPENRSCYSGGHQLWQGSEQQQFLEQLTSGMEPKNLTKDKDYSLGDDGMNPAPKKKKFGIKQMVKKVKRITGGKKDTTSSTDEQTAVLPTTSASKPQATVLADNASDVGEKKKKDKLIKRAIHSVQKAAKTFVHTLRDDEILEEEKEEEPVLNLEKPSKGMKMLDKVMNVLDLSKADQLNEIFNIERKDVRITKLAEFCLKYGETSELKNRALKLAKDGQFETLEEIKLASPNFIGREIGEFKSELYKAAQESHAAVQKVLKQHPSWSNTKLGLQLFHEELDAGRLTDAKTLMYKLHFQPDHTVVDVVKQLSNKQTRSEEDVEAATYMLQRMNQENQSGYAIYEDNKEGVSVFRNGLLQQLRNTPEGIAFLVTLLEPSFWHGNVTMQKKPALQLEALAEGDESKLKK